MLVHNSTVGLWKMSKQMRFKIIFNVLSKRCWRLRLRIPHLRWHLSIIIHGVLRCFFRSLGLRYYDGNKISFVGMEHFSIFRYTCRKCRWFVGKCSNVPTCFISINDLSKTTLLLLSLEALRISPGNEKFLKSCFSDLSHVVNLRRHNDWLIQIV